MTSFGDAYEMIMQNSQSGTGKQKFTLGKTKHSNRSRFGNEPDAPHVSQAPQGMALFPVPIAQPDGSVKFFATPDTSILPTKPVERNLHSKSSFTAIPSVHVPIVDMASDAMKKIAAGAGPVSSKFTNINDFSTREEFTLEPTWKRELQAKRRQEAAARPAETSGKISYQEAILRNPRPMISGVRTSFQKQGVTALLDKYRPSSTVYTGERPSVAIPSVIPQADLDVRTESVVVQSPSA